MNTETFHISTPVTRANCIAFISQIDDPNAIVVIKNKKETRSAAQLRLKWVWMGVLQKERAGFEGRNREGWNRYFKGKYIRPILLDQDEQYHEFFTNADRMLEQAPDDETRKWAINTFLDAIKTEWLNVKNMHEFMTLIDRYCTHQFQISLPVPNDLGWAYGREVKS
ncbi:MAG TPA: hypothetical protein ENI26_02050 [Methylophaga aminisulfidivorans]|uniref:NinB family protein n=2 Tax=root TaxID=1 RepID=A0A7C1W3G3_9GAMM|nr:hypothetical protein [Methylophaga aminisulfidivorans]